MGSNTQQYSGAASRSRASENSSPSTTWSGKRSPMSARNPRSTSRSISVTRSIAPFLSTRMAPPKCAIWICPARMTDSIAVARNTGGTASGTIHQFLDHPHFHAAVDRAAQHDIVHEAAHEEDAAAAGLEHVLRCEWIGHLLRIESFTLVEHAHDELARIRQWFERELHGHQFSRVFAIPVL